MRSTDFFDEDLLRAAGRHAGAAREKDSPGPAADADPDDVPVSAIPDISLTRMIRRRGRDAKEPEAALRHVEVLRERRDRLEAERHDLETRRHRSDDLRRNRRSMVDRLGRSVEKLEEREACVARLMEVVSGTRRRFKEMLEQLSVMADDDVLDSDPDAMDRAVGLVDDARIEHDQALARLELQMEDIAFAARPGPAADHIEDTFTARVRAGFAYSLPLATVLILLFLAWLLFRGPVGG